MNILYLLSGNLNYDLLICNDAGPAYALDMCWNIEYINSFDLQNDKNIIVVDNRIQEDEISKIETLISENTKTLFFLKIVDPYFENSTHYYYRFLSQIAHLANAYLLSVYEPKELTYELKQKFNDRFIHLPYAYYSEREIDVALKKNKILISGSINKFIYPYRYSVWEKATRSITRIFFFSILKHPGYAELNAGKTHSHGIVKDDFISYISKFKYLLLCPSRAYIELLKFNECAYAGCIPVGQSPDSYPPEIRALFLPLRPQYLVTDVFKIIYKTKNTDTIIKLRDFLNKTRNADSLNHTFKKFILENTFYTS